MALLKIHKKYIVTATGTDVGKTVFSAMLTLGLGTAYWKPVQSGLPADTETVRDLTGLGPDRFHPEAYRLTEPLSPHLAAKMDGVEVDVEKIVNAVPDGPVVIEGAGGLMVPLNRDILMIDLFRRLRFPVILCARTELGTINHTLLSLEALRARDIPVLGVAFIGPDRPDTVETVARMGGVKVLGRLPILETLDAGTLTETFAQAFRREDFDGTIPS